MVVVIVVVEAVVVKVVVVGWDVGGCLCFRIGIIIRVILYNTMREEREEEKKRYNLDLIN